MPSHGFVAATDSWYLVDSVKSMMMHGLVNPKLTDWFV
jgi:hypothetical protein